LLNDTHKFESGYTSSLLGIKNIENNKYLARSPINKTDKMRTPIIFFQGQQDRVVTPNQTEEIHKKIKSLGIDTEFFLYEDEGHGFKNQENISKSRALEEKFFIRHITSKLG
jgi:dipeptidyl aminopeptidase/acylaminoacyl peptidase